MWNWYQGFVLHLLIPKPIKEHFQLITDISVLIQKLATSSNQDCFSNFESIWMHCKNDCSRNLPIYKMFPIANVNKFHLIENLLTISVEYL